MTDDLCPVDEDDGMCLHGYGARDCAPHGPDADAGDVDIFPLDLGQGPDARWLDHTLADAIEEAEGKAMQAEFRAKFSIPAEQCVGCYLGDDGPVDARLRLRLRVPLLKGGGPGALTLAALADR